MERKDGIEHFINDAGIRMTVANISSVATQWKKIHHLTPFMANLLARVGACTAVLATDFKNKEGVSLVWDTKSTIGRIHTDVYDGQYIRGYIDMPDKEDISYTSEAEADVMSGNANLFLTRYSLLKSPYTGVVHLNRGSIADCFSQYLRESDQVLSFVKAEAKENENGFFASALLAQLLPGGSKDVFNKLFKSAEKESESIPWALRLRDVLTKGDFKEIHRGNIEWGCTCTEKRFKDALMGLPAAEKESLLEDGSIEVHCPYCGKTYRFTRDVLRVWFNSEGDING